MDEDWQAYLERWLAPYLEGLGNKTRRRICPAYIAGLIGPGGRKSIQPMAARSEAIAYDRLHHFIGAGLWDSVPLEATLWSQADDLVGGEPSTCRGRKPGWWASIARMANANTISRTCLPTSRSRLLIGAEMGPHIFTV